MKADVVISTSSLSDVPLLARVAEDLGFDGLWVSESKHDPFLPLVLVAEHTSSIEIGTSVAIAFARSPTVVAHSAWDLAAFSGGRFRLGLGTQVEAHVTQRFGMPWSAPVPRLREFIQAIRTAWDSWQHRTPPAFLGEHYRLTLMPPAFNPGPIDHPNIPIFTAGVNTPLCRLAGELADGFHVHSYHTLKYLKEVVRPTIEQGAAEAGRDPGAIELTCAVFVALGESESERAVDREAIREEVSIYASRPTYRPVLEVHGWGDVGRELEELAAQGRWRDMPPLISDEILAAFVVEGSWKSIWEKLHERYAGLLDRVALSRPLDMMGLENWRQI